MSKLITYHPALALFHQPQEMGTFFVDLGHFADMVRGRKYAPMRLTVNPSVAQLRRVCSGSFTSVDIETGAANKEESWTGLDPTRARLKTLGFGDDKAGVSIWWASAPWELQEEVRRILLNRSLIKVFHNGPWFDLRVMERYGLHVRKWVDTRDMRRAQSSTSSLRLSYLASLYDYTNNWKQNEDDEDAKGTVFTKSRTKLMRYNAQDCIQTSRVYKGLKAEEWGPRERKLYKVHAKLSVIAAEMHTTGIYVHKQWRSFMLSCLAQSIEEKRAALERLVNVDGFKATDDHMRAIIYRKHEWTKRVGGKKKGKDFRISRFGLDDPLNPKMYTDDTMETISVDEPSLLQLMASGEAPDDLLPILDAWWDLQGEKKRQGYVASKLIDKAMGPDGRLRPGWNSCGTDTMRFSCSRPNVMNIEQLLRHMLAPPPGKVIVHADKSQLELRVMEVVADDSVLKLALDTGDVYSFDAREWFGFPTNFDVKNLNPKARKAAKIIHLGSQYAAGIAAIFGQALKQDRTFTFAQARALNSQFKRTYAGTVDYWKREMERVLQCGYSEGRLLFGRRTYSRPPELSETVNYPIQRTAAEMMNMELITLHGRLQREVPAARIIIQLHDAIDVECHERDEEKVCKVMTEVMDREWEIQGKRRAFPIEMKVTRAREGGTWADV